jgi:hypothetical protein
MDIIQCDICNKQKRATTGLKWVAIAARKAGANKTVLFDLCPDCYKKLKEPFVGGSYLYDGQIDEHLKLQADNAVKEALGIKNDQT